GRASYPGIVVPFTLSWMSRALMPFVSVTMAWAIEMPGVSTPPTLVNAPNLMTSRRERGLLIMVSLLGGSGARPHSREPDGPVIRGVADTHTLLHAHERRFEQPRLGQRTVELPLRRIAAHVQAEALEGQNGRASG